MNAAEPAGHIYGRLLGFLRAHWVVFGLALLAVTADAAGQALFIYLLRPLIDETVAAAEPAIGLALPALVMGAVVLRVAGNFGGVYGMEWVGRRLIADLRRDLFARYLVLPAAYFDRESSGQMVSRLTYNTEQVAQAATTALIGVVRDCLTVLGLVAVMLIQSWRLTLTMLILVPVIALVVTVVSRRFRVISRRIQDSMGEVTHVTEEAVKGQEVIKVFGGGAQEAGVFERINDLNRRLNLKLRATQLVSSSLVQFTAGMAVVVLLLISSTPFMRADVTAGIFMSVLAAMVATIPPLKRLTTVHAVIQKGVAAAESIFEVLDTEAEPDSGSLEPGRLEGRVEFRDVNFRYAEKALPALRGVNLKLEPGTVTALVGRSGSGKTTLVRLLPRFYEPSAGEILIDGVDIRDYRLEALREQIALVGQDVVLFNDSVANNIAYGRLAGASRAEVEQAARDAHAMEFIERLPEGLDTPVGDAGALLSGGQRQRIAIARALLKDAPILLLDEATSALDAESERLVQQGLARLMKNRTTLVVAHRLSTVENAELVVVLDEGRVVESGRHRELLERPDSVYRYLYRLQLRPGDDPG